MEGSRRHEACDSGSSIRARVERRRQNCPARVSSQSLRQMNRIAESGPAMTPERFREVEAIYQSAMDQPPERRAAHVAETCGDDADLRRNVESLLKLNESPVLVDQPAWQAAAG